MAAPAAAAADFVSAPAACVLFKGEALFFFFPLCALPGTRVEGEKGEDSDSIGSACDANVLGGTGEETCIDIAPLWPRSLLLWACFDLTTEGVFCGCFGPGEVAIEYAGEEALDCGGERSSSSMDFETSTLLVVVAAGRGGAATTFSAAEMLFGDSLT